jgi:hypothetical protein
VVANIYNKENLKGISFEDKINIGTIPAGATIIKEIDLKSNEYLPEAKATFIVKISEVNGFNPKPIGIAFKTKKFEEPILKSGGLQNYR